MPPPGVVGVGNNMTRQLILTLLVAALLAPFASAQTGVSTASASMEFGDHETVDHQITVPGRLSYTADVLSARLRMSGIPVEYHVVDAPEWATVVIHPQRDVIPVDGAVNGATFYADRRFHLDIVLSPDAPVGQAAKIVVEAIVDGSTFAPYAYASAETLLVAAEPCHETAAEPEESVVLQTAAPPTMTAAGVSPLAIAGGALASLGVIGLAVRALRRK